MDASLFKSFQYPRIFQLVNIMIKSNKNFILSVLLLGTLLCAVSRSNAQVHGLVYIASGPAVRIPGIATATVASVYVYSSYPVQWKKNGVIVGTSSSHAITEAGYYYA